MTNTPSFDVWDETKNRANQAKHGVSFEVAQLAFFDVRRVIMRDIAHEKGEKRFFCFGLVNENVLTVRFSYRRKRIRIFGAGYWREGKKRYDKENKIHL
jgi:uncharacterized protein